MERFDKVRIRILWVQGQIQARAFATPRNTEMDTLMQSLTACKSYTQVNHTAPCIVFDVPWKGDTYTSMASLFNSLCNDNYFVITLRVLQTFKPSVSTCTSGSSRCCTTVCWLLLRRSLWQGRSSIPMLQSDRISLSVISTD